IYLQRCVLPIPAQRYAEQMYYPRERLRVPMSVHEIRAPYSRRHLSSRRPLNELGIGLYSQDAFPWGDDEERMGGIHPDCAILNFVNVKGFRSETPELEMEFDGY
ncbi:hypothetical protein ACO22_00901, partial [Paracoccidioides brasiliensis]